jgi:hypothetical protein
MERSQSTPSSSRPWRPRLLRALVWLFPTAAVLYVGSSLYDVTQSAWTVLSSDQWGLYTRYLTEDFPTGLLSLHNGHCLGFPGLVYLLDIHLAHAGNWLAIGVGLVLIGVTATVVAKLSLTEPGVPFSYRVTFASLPWIFLFWQGNARVLGDIAGVPVGFVLASVAIAALGLSRYRESLLEGRQSGLGGLLGLILGSAVLATLSYGFGVDLWPAILITGLLFGLPWKPFGILASGGLVGALASYLILLPNSDKARGALSLLDPLGAADLGVNWLGSPAFHILRSVVSDSSAALGARVFGILGVVVAALGVVRLYRRHRSGGRVGRLEIWCLVAMIFGLCCTGQVAFARLAKADANPVYIFAPRYLAWVMHFWIAILILAGLYCLRQRPRAVRRLWWAAIVLLPLFLLPTHRSLASVHERMKWSSREAAFALLVGVRDEASIRRALNPSIPRVFALTRILRDRRLNMFRWPVADWLGQPLEDIARVDTERNAWGEASRIEPLGEIGNPGARITGWAFDPTSWRPPNLVVAVDSQGRVRGLATLSRPRPARAERLDLPAETHLTFWGYLDTSHRPGKVYRYFAVLEKRSAFLARELMQPSRWPGSSQGSQ